MSGISNFNLANPTRIVFGKGQIAQLPNLIPKGSIVYMTYGGGSIKRNGVYDQVKEALKEYEIHEFGGIEANPDFDTLKKAVYEIRKLDMDRVFLLSVGGGSVCDGTKFIAGACKYTDSEDLWDMVLTHGMTCKEALPIGVVLTLPATGSENDNCGVISRRSLKYKDSVDNDLFYPRFSILDPLTTMSLPERQTKNGVVDSFVHVCEQYITVCAHADVQDRYAEALLRVLIDNGPVALREPNNYVARANVMWASTQALNTWMCPGVRQDWSTHMIGHELTAFLEMDHGRTLACIQPRLLEYKLESKKGKLAQMARRVFGLEGDDEEVLARKAIQCIVDFYEKDMEMPTHISAFVDTTDRSWVDKVYEKLSASHAVFGEDLDITPEVSRQIINDSF